MKMSRLVAFSSSLLFGAVIALTGAATANAAPSVQAVDYVALGDSYSSGVGSGSYIGSSGDCKRSTLAYPSLWAAANSPASFAFTACSGARTGDVTALPGDRSTPRPTSSRSPSAATTRDSPTS